MKKPFLFVLAVLLIGLISIYFIVPQIITTTSVVKIEANDVTVAKYLLNERQWNKWWPGQIDEVDSNLHTYNKVKYHLKQSTNSSMPVTIDVDGAQLQSEVIYAAEGEGLCAVSWISQKQSSLNPFTRISEFIRIKNQAKDIDSILAKFKTFMQADSNVYGLKFSVFKIKYPLTLATGTTTATYPAVALVYTLVEKLRKQIEAQGAKVMGSPMLNVNQADDNEYHVMVALQTDKQVKAGQGTVVNNMVMGANLLATEVKGGRGSIDNAFSQMKMYQKNHRLISPAIPFEQFVTNRLTEKDTAKWVTKLYWPIF